MSDEFPPTQDKASGNLISETAISAKRGNDYGQRLALIALIGLVVAAYLTFHHTQVARGYQIGDSFCNLSSDFDCDVIARSPYAMLFGIPVAFFGVIYYLLVALLSISKPPAQVAGSSLRWSASLFFLSLISIPPSLYLFFVSAVILQTYCLMCLVLDVVNILLVTVSWLALRSEVALTPGRGALALTTGGAVELFRLYFPLQASQRLFSLFTTIVAWLLVAGAIIGGNTVEQFLVRYYFQPRAESLMAKTTLLPFVEAWRNAPPIAKDVALSLEGSALGRDYALGNPNALVTIVGFSDYECPYCKMMSSYVKDAIKKNDPDLRYVFKDFPLDMDCNDTILAPKHKYACRAAIMTRCAALQGEEFFWKTQDAIYSLPWFSDDALRAIPEDLGLRKEEYESCLQSKDARDRVVADVQLGKTLNVRGTPMYFVNGRPLKVPPNYFHGVMKMIIEEVKQSAAEPK